MLQVTKRHEEEMARMCKKLNDVHAAEMLALRDGTKLYMEQELRLRLMQQEKYEETIKNLRAALQVAEEQVHAAEKAGQATATSRAWVSTVKVGLKVKTKEAELRKQTDEELQNARREMEKARELELRFAGERHKGRHLERMREIRQGCEVVFFDKKGKLPHMWMRLSDDEGRIDFGASALKARNISMSTQTHRDSIMLSDLRRVRIGPSAGKAFKERTLRGEDPFPRCNSVTFCMTDNSQQSVQFLTEGECMSWVLALRTELSTDKDADLLEYGRFLWTRTMLKLSVTAEDIKRHFRESGHPYIDAVSMREELAALGETLPEVEIDELVLEADTDGDGQLSLEEIYKRISLYAPE